MNNWWCVNVCKRSLPTACHTIPDQCIGNISKERKWSFSQLSFSLFCLPPLSQGKTELLTKQCRTAPSNEWLSQIESHNIIIESDWESQRPPKFNDMISPTIALDSTASTNSFTVTSYVFLPHDFQTFLNVCHSFFKRPFESLHSPEISLSQSVARLDLQEKHYNVMTTSVTICWYLQFV